MKIKPHKWDFTTKKKDQMDISCSLNFMELNAQKSSLNES